MKIEESLADIETEVGRINMDLQANEHERRDLVRLHDDIKNISEELQGVFRQQEKYADRFQEGSVKFGKAQQRLGEIEDALQALDGAYEESARLCLESTPLGDVQETVCCLDRTCDALTRAMGVR